ncbi:MAG TPA: hypothetical protein VIJ23_16700 [Mycobacterium sp.]
MERDTEQTTALRSTVRSRRDLVAHRVAVANQLRAHLQIVFPAAASLFRRHRLRHQPAIPGTLRHPDPRRLADGETPRGLAELGRLLQPHRSRGAARTDHRRPAASSASMPTPTPRSPRPTSRCCGPWPARSKPSRTGSPNSSACTRTGPS